MMNRLTTKLTAALLIGLGVVTPVVADTDADFAEVAAGEFMMGARLHPHSLLCYWEGEDKAEKKAIKHYKGPHFDEGPVRRVRISQPFLIGRKPVTLGEYDRFDPDHRAVVEARGMAWDPQAPVTFVTWDQAVAYCDWLSRQEGKPYRLPTEAEWEYAASQADDLGLEGMMDSVEQWCLDWWELYEGDDVVDPLGAPEGLVRVVRGGFKNPSHRITDRSATVPVDRRERLGFRVVQAEMPKGQYRSPRAMDRVYQDVKQTRKVWKKVSEKEPLFESVPAEKLFPDVKGATFEQRRKIPHWGRWKTPSMTYCDNGDLLVGAYGGPTDPHDQFSTIMTRLRDGDPIDQWDQVARVFVAPDRNTTGITLFNNGKGEVHMYLGYSDAFGKFNHVHGVGWNMLRRISLDNGATWTKPKLVREYPADETISKGVRQHIPKSRLTDSRKDLYEGNSRLWPHMRMRVLSDGRYALASDACVSSVPGSTIFTSDDNGTSWKEITRFGWNPTKTYPKEGGSAGWVAGYHAPFVELKNGNLLAFGRGNAINRYQPQSLSTDGGKSWTYSQSPFPEIGMNQRSVLMRLHEGPLLFISYTYMLSSAKTATGEGYVTKVTDIPVTVTNSQGDTEKRTGVFSALSFDEGKTWTNFKMIPSSRGKPAPAPAKWNRGYCTAVQTPDNMIHILFEFSVYVRCNLAWLLEPESF